MSGMFNVQSKPKAEGDPSAKAAKEKGNRRGHDNSPEFQGIVAENKRLRSEVHSLTSRIQDMEKWRGQQEQWNASAQKTVTGLVKRAEQFDGMHCPGCGAPNWGPGPQPCQACEYIAPKFRP